MSRHRHDNDLADARFSREAGERLREAASRLDRAIVASLDRARAEAIRASTGAGSGGEPAYRSRWLTAAAAAGVAVLVVAVFVRDPTGDLPALATDPSVADMEIVLAGDNLEMLEDLEFYAWLTDQQDAG